MISYNITDPVAIANYFPNGYTIIFEKDNNTTQYNCRDFLSFQQNAIQNEIIYSISIQVTPVSQSYCYPQVDLQDPNIMNYDRVLINVIFGLTPALVIDVTNLTHTPGFTVHKYIIEIKIRIVYQNPNVTDGEDIFVEVTTNIDAVHTKNRFEFIDTKKIGLSESINNKQWDYHKKNKHTVSLSDLLFSDKHEYKFLNYQDRIFSKREINDNQNNNIVGISGFTNRGFYINLILFSNSFPNVTYGDYIKKITWYDTTIYGLPFIHHRNGTDFYNLESFEVYSSGFYGQRSRNLIKQGVFDPFTNTINFQKGVVLAPNVYFSFVRNKGKLTIYRYNDFVPERYRLIKNSTNIIDVGSEIIDSGFFFSLDYDKFIILNDQNKNNFIFIVKDNRMHKTQAIRDVFLSLVENNNSFYNAAGHGGGYFIYYLFIQDSSLINIIPWQKMILRTIDKFNLFYMPLSLGYL